MLDASPLNPSIAEAQGMLYGFLCGGGGDPISVWLDQVLPMVDANEDSLREARDALRSYAAPLAQALRGQDANIQVFQPNEPASLLQRATAVYDWVRGFLYAMGVLKISERDLSAEGVEVYRDFAALTRMDLDDLEETEDNEQALMEVTEFVRVAALLIDAERPGSHREGGTP
ncbi:hypothetical protein CKO23_04065 [Thiocystis violacea]|nr:UPF0149 family protein [Thiocystis violacea]MBK1721430.1 hypothetical protein [Thiocystis violacea]